jgi:hypothetical protein
VDCLPSPKSLSFWVELVSASTLTITFFGTFGKNGIEGFFTGTFETATQVASRIKGDIEQRKMGLTWEV